jgi:hypothetical protein
MKLPENLNIIIPERKLTDYLLSETHAVGKAKAKYFRALGYGDENVGLLKESLVRIASANEVSEAISTTFGAKYVIDGIIVSPNGVTARIRTVWILETGETHLSFVTAYPAHG